MLAMKVSARSTVRTKFNKRQLTGSTVSPTEFAKRGDGRDGGRDGDGQYIAKRGDGRDGGRDGDGQYIAKRGDGRDGGRDGDGQ